MAIWDLPDALNHPLDFLLIQNGFINLFHQQAILDETMSWLRNNSYKILEVDAAAWQSQADLHQDVAQALDFPDYYGSNLDALNDCLSDVALRVYGWTAADTGLVLVIDDYETFEGKDASTAHRFLDIFARQASYAALFGHRMMCLVRTGDPCLELPPVGGLSVAWNHREFPSAR